MSPAALPADIAALYIPILLGLGLLILLVAWLPLVLSRLPLSLPIICVAIGAALFSIEPFSAYSMHPLETPRLVEHATELIVLISLMGAGLKIERAFGWRRWNLTIRLLAIVMPLSIGAFMLMGNWLLGLGTASALLLGAALAPTDPVLAADVQIEDPRTDQDDEARFALTSEAGANDSLAFPFVHLAIGVSAAGWTYATWTHWAIDAVVIRILVGFAAGLAGGWALGHLIYAIPSKGRLSRTGDGFVALGVTLAIYALTELLHGYGFLAVFLAGLMLRRAAANHDFNDRMHDFADEVERLLMMVMLVAFGGMLTAGGVLQDVGWRELAFALLVLFVVRPLAGAIAMAGVARPPLEKGIIAFFGIRGLGSVYYLAYGLNQGGFADAGRLWGVVGLVILISILLHGITVTPMMRLLDRHREEAA